MPFHALKNPYPISYSPDDIRHMIRPADFWLRALSPSTLAADSEAISIEFHSTNSAVKDIQQRVAGPKPVFTACSLYDVLCLRHTDRILRSALLTPIAYRADEIRQLVASIRGETNASIYRTDIQSFFETINFHALISSLESRKNLPNRTILHLKSLSEILRTKWNFFGLPRGINISSTLAQYALRHLDLFLLRAEGICFYSRYVDDICIIHEHDHASIEKLIIDNLPKPLTLNTTKTQHISPPSTQPLNYLGYCITTSPTLSVGISPRKIAKYKLRITLSLKNYLKTSDFALLLRRLEFLSGRTRMTVRGRRTDIYVGLRDTYPECSSDRIDQEIRSLDSFYHGILRSKRYYLAKRLRATLSTTEWGTLNSISFQNRDRIRFARTRTHEELAKITNVWKYA